MDIQTMQPEYVKEFSCIADKCEDTCCRGWGVQIDKKTFKEYKKIQKSSLDGREFFQGKFVQNKQSNSIHDYGIMRLDSDGRCMFLNDKNLCGIVLKYGPDKLCKTCTSFPRSYSLYKKTEHQELALTTACPEATRKIISQHKKLTFVVQDTNKFDVFSFLQSEQDTTKKMYTFEIRFLIIKVLQSDLYNLNEKMSIISLLCQKIISEQNVHFIPEILNDFEKILLKKIDTTNLKTGNKFSYELLLFTAENKKSTNKKFNTIIENCLNGVLKDYETFYKAMSNFNKYETKINEFVPYALENYLVNYVFKNNFPMKNGNILDSLFLINIHFAFVKMMILNEIDLSEKNYDIYFSKLVDIIYSSGRALEHDAYYFGEMMKDLKKHNNYSVPHALMIS